MFTAMKQRRDRLVTMVQDYVHHADLDEEESKEAKDDGGLRDERELVSLLRDWLEIRDDKSDKATLLFDKMKPYFEKLVPEKPDATLGAPLLYKIWSERDMVRLHSM